MISDPDSDFEIGLMVGVNGQQRMLTPPWHLFLPSLLSVVPVAVHSTLHFLFWIVITCNTMLTSLFDISTG
jgi:hypothetical protein